MITVLHGTVIDRGLPWDNFHENYV